MTNRALINGIRRQDGLYLSRSDLKTLIRKGFMKMRGKALTVITALILSYALISCSQQEQVAEKQRTPPEKASSSISVPVQPAKPAKPDRAASSAVLKEFAQEITTDSKIEKMRAKEMVVVSVNVKNTSAETWPAEQTENPVRLSYHWLDNKGEEIVWDGKRTFLPNILAPGSSVVLKAEVKSTGKPGSYVLRFTMVQENVAWFEQKGAKPLDIPVTVIK